MVALDGYIDEYGWLNTGSTVTDEIAAQYAATLYNGGAGRFYRATTGWL